MGTLSKIQRYYFFHGEEEYLKWKRIRNLVNKFVEPGFRDFDYTFYEGRGLDGATLINTVSSSPFGSPLRVTVVRNFHKMLPKHQETVVKFIDKIPEYSTLVLEVGELKYQDKRKKIYKTLMANKDSNREFKKPDPAEAIKLMAEFAGELQINISEKALDYLVETVGQDIGILEQELQKVATYADGRESVTEDDIAHLIGAGTLGTVSDLPIKIGQRDISGALKLLHKLLLKKESEGTILFRIKDYFLKLNAAKMYKASSPYALMKSLRCSKMVAEEVAKAAPGISSSAIIDCLHDIYEAEISLKSARLKKNIMLINLVSGLGARLDGNKQASRLYKK